MIDFKKEILELNNKGYLNVLPSKLYLKLVYYSKLDKKLNLKCPKRFSEKIQWLKIYDHKDIYTVMADKYLAKEYVSNIIGDEYIIPTIAVYNNYDEVDYNKLPNKFVMKCNHDSGSVIACRDKNKLDKENARLLLTHNLNRNYYWNGRQWCYKNIKPRIIVEEFIGEDLSDYRFYCFNGKVKYIFQYENKCVSNDTKPQPTYCNVYDRYWKKQKFRNLYESIPYNVKKPKNLHIMIRLAEKLSKDTKFLRVDFYNYNGKIYFGELTFYPGGGFSKFYPDEYDFVLGDLIDINRKKM